MFEIYLKNIIETSDKLNYSFQGVNKKQFPKWNGWKIIAKHKENGITVKQIHDETLDVLVHNFHFVAYLNFLLK